MRLAAFLLLVGCGGNAFEEFQRERIDATCGYLVRCGAVATVADCRVYYARTEIDDPNVEAAIEAGKVIFDEDAAAACIAALDELTCDRTIQTGDELAPCDEVLSGALAEGDECAFDRECRSDNCEVPDCAMACCIGTCGPADPLPAIGEPCTFLCEGDAYCGMDEVCVGYLGAGATCDRFFFLCGAGLYCAGDTMLIRSGVCAPLPHLGEVCEDACAEIGTVCSDNACVAAGLPGDACMSYADCSAYYECSPRLECVAYPTLGMPCDLYCADGAYCDSTRTCVTQKQNGEQCMYNDECATHFCDDGLCADVPRCI